MVSGKNGKSSSNYSRYYHCGNYHRNGSTVCKRNSIPKDKIETAVSNCLIREFSLLSFPESLEDEIRRFSNNQNRESTFQLARIIDDIKHTSKRITRAKEEKILPDASPYVAQYISELEKELEKLSAERAGIVKLTTYIDLTQEQLQLIRDRLKDFEPSEVQHILIKQYIESIVREQNGHFKVQFYVNYPSKSDDTLVKILQKTVFISLD